MELLTALFRHWPSLVAVRKRHLEMHDGGQGLARQTQARKIGECEGFETQYEKETRNETQISANALKLTWR